MELSKRTFARPRDWCGGLALGLAVVLCTPSLAATNPPPKAKPKAAAPAAPAPAPQAADPPPLDLASWCEAVLGRVPKLPNLSCTDAPLVAGDGRSVRGTPLWTADVPPAPHSAGSPLRPVSSGPPLRVLVIGGIHGDEAASVSLVLDWIERARALASPRIHWRFTPLVNPDGLLRRPSTRVNSRGVDLNRNFPTLNWDKEAPAYWIRRTQRDPRRFPGRSPLSEPESRWVQRQMDQWQPNLIVSVHAPYGVLDFDGPPPPPYRMGSLILDQVGVFPGSLGNYGGIVRQVPVVTIELRHALNLQPAEGLAMWDDMTNWIAQRLLPTQQAANSQAASTPAR